LLGANTCDAKCSAIDHDTTHFQLRHLVTGSANNVKTNHSKNVLSNANSVFLWCLLAVFSELDNFRVNMSNVHLGNALV